MAYFRIMRKLVIFLFFLSVPAFAQTNFVSVQGTHFIRDGKPYHYVGANYWYGALLGSEKHGDRKRLVRELDQMKAAGITNLRVMAGADGGQYDYTVPYALQPEQGRYDEDLFEGLDFLLSEMGKRHMAAILYLTNNWEWSGGMAQYLEWNGHGKIPNPNIDPANTWEKFMDYVAQFHSCGACRQALQAHIGHVIGRTNVYTKKKYADDPAIMAWEVANEPRIFNAGNERNFTDWLNQSVDLIDSLDQNHLICTGSEGAIGSLDIKTFKRTHQNPHIDYLTLHIWPKNWEWYNASKELETLPAAIEKSNIYLDEHLKAGAEMNRPVVLEEFGLPRRDESREPSANTDSREAFYRLFCSRLLASEKSGGPLAGINFWGYGGEGRAANDRGKWNAGDAFTADPPQEPQGLNTVFDTDSAILELIRKTNLSLKPGK
jgi:mannan endo-1,4-beta-mannosidase